MLKIDIKFWYINECNEIKYNKRINFVFFLFQGMKISLGDTIKKVQKTNNFIVS